MAKKETSQRNIFIFIVGAVFLLLFWAYFENHKMQSSFSSNTTATQSSLFNFGNQKVTLNNQYFTFTNGSFSTKGHTATITNRTLNRNQTQAAAILIDNPGGSGTFYYLVGGTLIGGKEIYSKPVLLGDRIKILSVGVENPSEHNTGVITVHSLTRAKNAPMATEPVVHETEMYAFTDNGNLIKVLH